VLGEGFGEPPLGRPHIARHTQADAHRYGRGRVHLLLPAVGVTTKAGVKRKRLEAMLLSVAEPRVTWRRA
jgi:hypothetical protein